MQPEEISRPRREQVILAVARQLERIQQDYGSPRVLLTWGVNSDDPDDWPPIAKFLEYPITGYDHEGDSKEAALTRALEELPDYLISCSEHGAEERGDDLSSEDDEFEQLWKIATPLDENRVAEALGEWAACATFLDIRDSGSRHIPPAVAQQWVDEFSKLEFDGPPRETWEDSDYADDED